MQIFQIHKLFRRIYLDLSKTFRDNKTHEQQDDFICDLCVETDESRLLSSCFPISEIAQVMLLKHISGIPLFEELFYKLSLPKHPPV